jgi:hypothetical protein
MTALIFIPQLAQPVYSLIPADHTDPAALSDLAQRRWRDSPEIYTARDKYPALPWKMNELAPSQWRNIFTGGLFQVTELKSVRRHHVYPEPIDATRPIGALGLWWNARFVIEDWARVDQLPLAVQMKWYAFELTYHRRRWSELQVSRHADRFDHDAARLALRSAELAARQFAEQHALPPPPIALVRATPVGPAMQYGFW